MEGGCSQDSLSHATRESNSGLYYEEEIPPPICLRIFGCRQTA